MRRPVVTRALTFLLMLAPAALAAGEGGIAGSSVAGAERPSDRVETAEFPDRLRAGFRADTPGIVLAYDLSYRLLGVTLVRLGEMHIEAMTGHLKDDPSKTAACLIDCRMTPPASADPRAVLRDRFVLLADAATRKTLVFAQLSDESYRPLIGRTRRKLQFGLHDYRGVEPYTFRTNLITGTTAARVGDRPGRERPGEAVMTLLTLLADVYAGRAPDVDPQSSPRIFVHIDGALRPFVAKTSRDDPPGAFPREEMGDVLRADIAAAPEADIHRGRLVAWVLSFDEIVRRAGRAIPADPARIPPVPIVPLAVDCELSVGTLRAVLKSIGPAGQPPHVLSRSIPYGPRG